MRTVPQEKYDTAYYKHNCDGFTEDGSLCRRLSTLLGQYPWTGSPRRVLDVGCGRGEVAKYLTAMGHKVVSMDYSVASMEMFHKLNGATVPFIRHDAGEGLWFIAPHCFDVVILADIVEHLYKEQLCALGIAVSYSCRPQGTILIDTPIMNGGESELHVDIKASAAEVHAFFPDTTLVGTHWHKKPEHCNIILRKV